jgi:hypothetical protein
LRASPASETVTETGKVAAQDVATRPATLTAHDAVSNGGRLMRRSGLVRRGLLAVMATGAVAAVFAPIASAHDGSVTLSCSGATYTFDNASFGYGGSSETQTVQETIYIDGSSSQAAQTTVQINPLVAGTTTSTLPISVPADGKSHTVEADALNLTTGVEVQVLSLGSGQTDTNGYFPIYQAVTCSSQSASGALTPGYWKNHEAATTALLPQTLGTYTVSTFSQAHAVFAGMNCGASSAQNAFGCLAGHLLAAELNVANGATTPACASTAIIEANDLLSSGGYVGPTGSYTLTAEQRQTAIDLVSTLNSYNNNQLTC